MAISPTTLIGAAGNTTNQSTPYALGSITPPADYLVMVIATVSAASTLSPLIIGGGLGATWVEVANLDILGGRRLGVWIAIIPAGGLSGNITIGNTTAMTMTGIASQVIRWSGTYLGADATYGLGQNSNASATSLQAPPVGPYASPDATVAILAHNQNVAITCERTELGDAGFATPTHRLAVQWHTADDADGPSFSWTGAAVCHAITFYLRDAAYSPPATDLPIYPGAIIVHAA